MATYNKINVFVEDLANAIHDVFGTAGTADSLRCMLMTSATAPAATDTAVDTTTGTVTMVASASTEIANGNGYTKKGELATNDGTRSAGTLTVAGTKIVWTCVTSAMAAFRYVVLYNDTKKTTATRAPIAWWDYGSALTLQVGETFSIKFNNSDTVGTIFTLA